MKGKAFKDFEFPRVVDGSKTHFREIMKPQPIYPYLHPQIFSDEKGRYDFSFCQEELNTRLSFQVKTSRFKIGEKVYLKEPYAEANFGKCCYKYAPHDILFSTIDFEGIKWKNKLFMPEKYARYFIKITGVRCERLQEISDEDCFAEGIIESNKKGVFFSNAVQYGGARKGICKIFDIPQLAYAALIDKINGKGTWESNPYVWVYNFKLIKQ